MIYYLDYGDNLARIYIRQTYQLVHFQHVQFSVLLKILPQLKNAVTHSAETF